jgi:putative PEP-CTERM system TPR-repeat lipoprotein
MQVSKIAVRLPVLAVSLALVAISGCDKAPKDASEFAQKAEQARFSGRFNEALIAAKNAIQAEPNSPAHHQLLAKIYLDMQLPEESLREVAAAVKLGVNAEAVNPDKAGALLMLRRFGDVLDLPASAPTYSKQTSAIMTELHARALIGSGKRQEGCATFDQSLQYDVQHVRAHWGKIECAVVAGDVNKAKSLLGEVLKLQPKDSGSWALQGDFQMADQQYAQAADSYRKAVQLVPGNLVAWVGLASAQVELGKYDDAKKAMLEATKINPDYVPLVHIRGVMEFRQERFKDARSTFEKVLRAAPDYMPSVLWYGLTNFKLGNLEIAATELGRYLQVYPNSARIRSLLALSLASKGEADQAEKVLAEINKEDVGSLPLWANVGHAYLMLGQGDKASDWLSKAVKQSPQNEISQLQLAQAYLQSGETKKAIASLEDYLKQYGGSDKTEYVLINAYISDRDYDKAHAKLLVLQKKSPTSPMPHFTLGRIAWIKGDRARASAEFDTALKKDPKFDAAVHAQALLAIEGGDQKRALALLKKQLEINPDSIALLMGAFALERAMGDNAAAMSHLQLAVDKAPNDLVVVREYAQTMMRQGRPDLVVSMLRRALAQTPDDINLLGLLGAASTASGDYANAVATYKKMITLQPKNIDLKVRLAAALGGMGSYAAQREALMDALKLDPAHIDARARLVSLDVLEKRYAEALAGSALLQKSHPDSAVGWLSEAETYLHQQKFVDSKRVLSTALAKFPTHAGVNYAYARMLWLSGAHDNALTFASSWVVKNPKDINMLRFLAKGNTSLDRSEQAIQYNEALLKMLPEDTEAINNLAWLLRVKDTQRAMQLAKRGVALAPKNPAMLDTLGSVYLVDKDFAAAIKNFRLALDIPGCPLVVRLHLANALLGNKDDAQAKRELERLLAVNTPFAERGEAEALLAKLNK